MALNWTEAIDARLRRLRGEGAGWGAIATELGISPDVARERGRRIGARPPETPPPPQTDDPRRPPLPPGHGRAWGLINQGTLLADTAWPGWAG